MRFLTVILAGCLCAGVAGADEDLDSLNTRAADLSRKGDYAGATEVAEQAAQVAELRFGNDAAETATPIDRLAALYRAQGRQAEAEPLHKRALAIREKALGKDHPDTAESLANLAFLYSLQGKEAEAEQLHKRALAIREKALGKDHPDTAQSCFLLGSLYGHQGNYAKSAPLLQQALAIRETVLGKEHPDTATSVGELAFIYEWQGNYSTAEQLHKQALEMREQALGPDHPHTAASLNNLAKFYECQGKYAEAEPLYERTLAILEKEFGHGNENLAMSLNNFSVLQAALGQFPKAAALADRARRSTRQHVARVLPSLPAAEQAVFLQAQQGEARYHVALTLGLLQKASPQIASLSAGWLANGKAVAQEALSQQILLARQDDDAETVELVGLLRSVRNDLARFSQVMPSPDHASAYRANVASFQREELRLISEIGGQLATINREEPWVEIDAIRKNIPPSSVLIDIARFRIFNFEARGGDKWLPAHYAAWIVRPVGADDITIVDLGDAAEIDALVADYRRSIESREPEIPAAKQLAARVLQPILAAVPAGGGMIDELILSPDGALWLLPWQALPLEDGRYAIERYTIRTVISGRSLVPPPPSAKPLGETSAPIFMADPDFDRPMPAGETKPPSGATGRFLEPVGPLPNTKSEAEAAHGPLGSLAGVEPVVKLGGDATETELKSLAVRPKVLVLATHGFFLPDQEMAPADRLALGSARNVTITRPTDTSGREFVDPLLRCGLLLAGANQTLSGQPTGSDDGILTGAEIVGLDLLGTDLVVLSACETGVGDVRNGEGVAGLRQAFQIAGAPTVVSTLWRVPDAESAGIMTEFYQHLAAGKSASVALREAQLSFITASRKGTDEKAVAPYLWAAYGVTGR